MPLQKVIAIVPTACGIETCFSVTHIEGDITIAIVPTACGIETEIPTPSKYAVSIAIVPTACGIETINC